MYGMTLGVSYTPMDRELGAKSRTDTQPATLNLDTLDDDQELIKRKQKFQITLQFI